MLIRNLCALVLRCLAVYVTFVAVDADEDIHAAALVSRQITKQCFTSSQSKSGNISTCSGQTGTSDDCCVKRCKDNKCRCGRDSDFCRSEADCCSFAKKCVDNKCVCNGPGGACTENKQCCSKICKKDGKESNKICECSAIGQYCGDVLDCCTGAYCSPKKKCAKMVDPGGSCKSNVECGSGICSGGRCGCSPAKSLCFRKVDCCTLPNKPPAAVGCVMGVCTDCIPSTILQITDMGDFCEKKGPSEACCIGSCFKKNKCDYPRKTGDYCVNSSECRFQVDECINNKCTRYCLPKGANCDETATQECCSESCNTYTPDFGKKKMTCN